MISPLILSLSLSLSLSLQVQEHSALPKVDDADSISALLAKLAVVRRERERKRERKREERNEKK